MEERELDEIMKILSKKEEISREVGDVMTLFRILEKLTRYEFFEYESRLPTEVISDEEPPIKVDDKF